MNWADAVVVGGGSAGICAALSLGRQGKKTVLITDRPVLGGNSSSEIRVWTRGATGGGNLFSEEMGIWGELKLRNLYVNPEGNPIFWDDVLLEQVLEEKNITLFLNTHITTVTMKDETTIESVGGFQMGTEKEMTLFGEMFIDATGDGTLGALANLPFCIGKESRKIYSESFAPEQAEKTTFGNTIFFFTRQETQPVRYVPPQFAYSLEYVRELLGKGGRIVNETMNGCDYWWFETGGMMDTIADSQEITIELKRLVAGVWNYVKNSGEFNAEYLTLAWEGNLPGKRESRRMITEKVLTQQDVLEGSVFDDAAFYGGWYLDFHPSDGIYAQEESCIQVPVQIYGIPLSCLYHRDMKNLLFAGRNIGVSHVAFASTRIMNTCALSGQAAGTLASICLDEKISPNLLDQTQIVKIQQALLQEDVMIPGVFHDDKQDLAKKAEVVVSSVENQGTDNTGGFYSLWQGGFLVLPSIGGETAFLLKAEQETNLEYEYYLSDIPSRIAYGERKGKGSIQVQSGESWVRFPIPEIQGERFITIVFEHEAQVFLGLSHKQCPGFLAGHKEQPEYVYPCVRLAAHNSVYSGESLINGYSRMWKKPNIWMSQEEEIPTIWLKWKVPVNVKKILLYLNPDLSMELVSSKAETWNEHHKFAARTGMPAQLVKSGKIYGREFNGEYRLLTQFSENWKRRVQLDLEKNVALTELKVEITSTYGAKHGEVFEIRVY